MNTRIEDNDFLEQYEGVIEAIAPLWEKYMVFADPNREKGLSLRILKNPTSSLSKKIRRVYRPLLFRRFPDRPRRPCTQPLIYLDMASRGPLRP